MKQPKKILITRTDRLGDVILSTPVIRALRNKYPDAFIAMMVRPYTADVVKNNPHLDEVIVYDKYREHKSLISSLKFAKNLKKYNFDTAVALHPTNRVHIMLYAAGIETRIGYDRKMGFLLTDKVAHKKEEGIKHEARYNFDMLREAGIDLDGENLIPYMNVSPDEEKLVENVLRDLGIKDKFIAVHPGASCPSKRWPADKFAEAVKRFIEDGYGIVLIGGPESEECNKYISERSVGPVHDLTDMFHIGELAGLLKHSAVLVSNDSGPVHVAVSVGTPVVAIFGRSDPGLSPLRWGPLGANDIIVHKNAGCSECLAHNCVKGFTCLDNVSVDEVVEAARRIIDNKERKW